MGMALADMVAGSIIIEQVFSIPGLEDSSDSISNRVIRWVEALLLLLHLL